MTEIQECEVEQVGNENKFSGPEVATNPAHDETELKKIVQDVVAPNICAAVEILGIGAPEESNIIELEDEGQHPVNRGHDGVERERRSIDVVLAPDGSVVGMVLMALWLGERIVGTAQDHQQP